MRTWRAWLVIVMLAAAAVPVGAAEPAITYTPVLELPLIPPLRTTVTPALREIVLRIEMGRLQKTDFADRPAAETVPKSTEWAVRDCLDDTCVAGGGTLTCATMRSEVSGAWEVIGCYGASSGGGATPLLSFSSCGVIDGTVQVFLGPANCADQAEGRAVAKLKNAATLGQLACALSADSGPRTITVTGRKGTCGAPLSDTSLVCTIGAGQAACDSGSTSMALTGGECLALRVSANGALPGDRVLTCTMERVS